MRDLDLPLKGPGYLDFARLGTQPNDAARIWIADYIRLYEGVSGTSRGDYCRDAYRAAVRPLVRQLRLGDGRIPRAAAPE